MSEQTKTYRGAIIGLGYIGGADQVSGDVLGQRVENLDGTHYHAMDKHPRVELVAGSSRDSGRRERFEERAGVRTYADWREMIESESIDIVSVATYTPVHAEPTIAAAERGIRAIYCEKPIAPTLVDAEKMIEACERNSSILVINHNRRFKADFRRLKELIAAGELGELVSVTVEWPSGRLGNVGTHMFDAVRMVTGREVEAVSASLDPSRAPDCRGPDFRDPGGWGVLRLDGGIPVVFSAPSDSSAPPRLAVVGTKGRAIVTADVTVELSDGRKETCPSESAERSAMDRAMIEIVEWLDGGGNFPYPASESLGTFEAIVGCHASHRRNGAWTDLPLSGADREIVVQSG
jgi:predicted dehydrogenase